MFMNDVRVLTLAQLPTPPQESGVILFMPSVLFSYLLLLLLLCVSCRLCVQTWWSVALPGCIVKSRSAAILPCYFHGLLEILLLASFLRRISVWFKVGETECHKSLICLFGSVLRLVEGKQDQTHSEMSWVPLAVTQVTCHWSGRTGLFA